MALVKIVDLKILAQSDDARRQLDVIAARAEAIGKLDPTIKVKVDRTAVTQGLAVLAAETKALSKDVTIGVNSDGLVAAAAKAKAANTALNMMTDSATRGGGAWAFLTTRMTLFGGVFNGILPKFLAFVGVWHVLVDGIIEFAAVLIPAGIALAAFGAAAAGTVGDIVTHMKDLNTVSTATGKSIYPMTGAFGALSEAVKPQVYQVFGDALTIMNSKTGEFTKLATGAGSVVESLAARLTVAVTHGNGFNGFLRNAIPDLAKLGDIVGNLGGVFGNLFNAMPGYAQTLLNIADGGSRVLEWATRVGEPVVAAGLAFHGAFLYMGLGASLMAFTVSKSLGALASLSTRAAVAARDSTLLGGAGTFASKGLFSLGAGAESAAALPWGWIAIAAAGIGFLAYKILTAKDATQRWLGTLQSTLLAQGAVQAMTTLLSDQAIVAQQLMLARIALNKTVDTNATGREITAVGSGTAAYMAQVAAVSELTSGERQLRDEAVLYTYRLGLLSSMYGGVAHAQGLLTAAGVTFAEMMDTSSTGLAKVLQKVGAMVAAYSAMGQHAGVLGADLNALSIAESDQVTAMGNLNTAWDKTIGIVSGGQGTFIAFEQALQTVGTNAKTAGASMGGLNAPSLALRAAWQSVYTGGASLIDALRMMSSVSPGGFPSITRAMKDTLAQMLPMGKQTAATRAEMVSLAQEVNPNITNFRQLTTWLGKTHDAGRDLNKILAASGINIEDLAKDAANLSDALQSDVTQQMAQARLAASGADRAISQLARDMTEPHTWNQIHIDQLRLYNDLRTSGMSAKDAAAEVSVLGGQLFRLPKNTKVGVTLHVGGSGTITAKIEAAQVSKLERLSMYASGGRVPGYGDGDTVPAWLTPGEAVVPRHLVPAIAPFLSANQVPGFAAGGVAGIAPWGAAQARTMGHLSESDFAGAANAAFAAIANGILAAMKKAPGYGTPGPGGGAPANNAALAQLMYGNVMRPGDWAAWNYVAMAESGWNQFARNPSSGAYGIPQALPGSKMGPAANPPQSNPAAQISWMWNYMQAMYGGPQGAAAHERAFRWYDQGGWLPPGLSMAYNGTGRPEPVGQGTGRAGPLVSIGQMTVREEADLSILSQKLGFALTAAGL